MATENRYINIYFKAGGENGSEEGAIQEQPGDEPALSSDGAQSNPLTVTINSSENQVLFRKCGIRTQKGFETSGNTTIGFTGGVDLPKDSSGNPQGLTCLCWRIAADRDTLANSGITAQNMASAQNSLDKVETLRRLVITDKIEATANKIFWIMVLAASDEQPVVDKSVSIVTTATIAAVDSSDTTGTGTTTP